MRIEHVAIWTADLERLKAFYERSFGAQAGTLYENPRRGFRSYFLRFEGGARLELMTLTGLGEREVSPGPLAEAAAQAAAEATAHSPASLPSLPNLGYAHISLCLPSPDQVDLLTERLRQAGCPVASAPRRTGDGYYESVILDPDGNHVELLACPDAGD